MTGQSVDLDEAQWQDWEDPVHGHSDKVRWTTIFGEDISPVVGIADISPGGALPNHHHTPAEIYHVISGEGEVEIAGTVHALREGMTACIPADEWHETRNTGSASLRILYFFPHARFDEVDYHFE